MAAEGLNLPDGYIIAVQDNEFAGAEALSSLLALSPRPTAVCCISDENAIPLVHALRLIRIPRVPEDISVIDSMTDGTSAQYINRSARPSVLRSIEADAAIRLSRGEILTESCIVALRRSCCAAPQAQHLEIKHRHLMSAFEMHIIIAEAKQQVPARGRTTG